MDANKSRNHIDDLVNEWILVYYPYQFKIFQFLNLQLLFIFTQLRDLHHSTSKNYLFNLTVYLILASMFTIYLSYFAIEDFAKHYLRIYIDVWH